MPTVEPRIVVVGAGISGLTLAAALAGAGVRCEVLERAPRLVEVGAGVQLAPNAVRLLRRLGLGQHLRAVAVRPEAVEMCRWEDGRTLVRTPLGAECEQVFGAPYYTVHRADLQAGLLQLVDPDTVRLGQHCLSAVERPGVVELGLEGGRVVAAEVAVGADGIRSVLRGALFPDRPRFSGHMVYRGLVPADRVSWFAADPRVRLWLGPERHCVAYPVSASQMISFAATAPADDAWNPESWTTPGEVGDLLRAYQGWDPCLLALLAAADSVSRWGLHDRDPISRWSSDRTTLVGDAAHPMLPFLAQGANQAVEDAVVLAEFLRTATAGSAPVALRRYERVRMARTTEVQRRSRANATALHLPDGAGQRGRDARLARAGGLADQDWLYGYDAVEAARAGSAG